MKSGHTFWRSCMRETIHEGMCEISHQNDQIENTFEEKYHTFPHGLSPSCKSSEMGDQFTKELNIYTTLWN